MEINKGMSSDGQETPARPSRGSDDRRSSGLKVCVEIGNNPAADKRAGGTSLQLISINEYIGQVEKLDGIKRKRRSSTRRRKDTSTSSSFPNRVITHFGEYKAALESNSQEVATCVEQFVQQLLKAAGSKDARFVGRLRSCGSYYDGLKIQHPNEFSYLLELSQASLRFDDVEWKRVIPDSVTTSSRPDVYGRPYFRASFRDRVPPRWRCPSCMIDKCSVCQHRRELNARQVQRDFLEALKAAVVSLNASWSNAEIDCSGSGVTLYSKLDAAASSRGLLNRHGLKKVRQHRDTEFFFIKISITLAVPVEKKLSTTKWPMEGYDDLELDPDLFGSDTDIKKCHLVTAGDYWQVSFQQLERKLLLKLTEDPGKKKCFQAIKYLRNQVTAVDPALDSWYIIRPLILSFLKENKRHDKEEEWRFWSLSKRVKSMLSGVERGTATHYFTNDEHTHSQRQQLSTDCRQIARYLEKTEQVYNVNGMIHFLMMVLLFFNHLLLFSMSVAYLSPIQQQTVSCNTTSSVKSHIGSYGFTHLPISFISLVISATGFIWIITKRLLMQSYNVLYDMYRGIVYVYVIFAILDMLLAGFGIGLAVLITDLFESSCEQWNSSGVLALTLCTICVTGFVLLAMSGHALFYTISVHGRLTQYKWEIVLSDFIYKDAFPCLRRNTRDPPRVSVSVNKKESVADDVDTDSECEDIRGVVVSTLERKCEHRQRDDGESVCDKTSVSLSGPDGYEGYRGRFNPISPMQSVGKCNSGSVCTSPPSSPVERNASPCGERSTDIWPSPTHSQSYRSTAAPTQSPLATPPVYIVPDYPDPIPAAPADILDLSYESGSSTTNPRANGMRNGWSLSNREGVHQILDAKAVLNRSYERTPKTNPSMTESCLSGVSRHSWTDAPAVDATHFPKQHCRFIDVAI